MKNLRTQYGKELGKVKASTSCGSGTIEVYIPTWKYYDQVQFLRDSLHQSRLDQALESLLA